MPRFNVTPKKEAELLQRMERLGVREADLVEKFIRGSGPGGQKRNKTSSCVQLTHVPSGIEVRSDRERLQSVNRFLARRGLCDRLEGGPPPGQAKARKQKKRRARRRKAAVKADSSG